MLEFFYNYTKRTINMQRVNAHSIYPNTSATSNSRLWERITNVMLSALSISVNVGVIIVACKYPRQTMKVIAGCILGGAALAALVATIAITKFALTKFCPDLICKQQANNQIANIVSAFCRQNSGFSPTNACNPLLENGGEHYNPIFKAWVCISMYCDNKQSELDFGGLRLKSIPSALYILPRLEKLNLRNNKLTTIPAGFKDWLKSRAKEGPFEVDLTCAFVNEAPYLELERWYETLDPDVQGNLTMKFLDAADRKSVRAINEIADLIMLEHLDSLPQGSVFDPYSFRETELGVKFDALHKIIEYYKNTASELDFSEMELASIPNALYSLPRLKKLNLRDNELAAIPDGFKYWLELCAKKGPFEVDLTCAFVNEAPYLELEQWYETLDPDVQGNLTMKFLDAADRQIVRKIEGRAASLESNCWETLDSELGLDYEAFLETEEGLEHYALSAIIDYYKDKASMLILRGVGITSILNEVYDLPRLETLDLRDNKLDALPGRFKRFLLERAEQNERFTVYLIGAFTNEAVYADLKDWYLKLGAEQKEKLNLILPEKYAVNQLLDKESYAFYGRCTSEEQKQIMNWLNRFWDMKGFTEKQEVFAHLVNNYMSRAAEDETFRNIFFARIKDAASTCGDRVALSVLKIGVAYDISQLNPNNPRAAADFLKKVWALDILEDVARAKIEQVKETLGAGEEIDEVEIYLDYPIKLKDELELPIHIDEMLFADYTQLTEEELAAAKASVLELINSPEGFYRFLVHNDKWRQILRNKDNDKIEKIFNGEGDMEAQMVELTKQLLIK